MRQRCHNHQQSRDYFLAFQWEEAAVNATCSGQQRTFNGLQLPGPLNKPAEDTRVPVVPKDKSGTDPGGGDGHFPQAAPTAHRRGPAGKLAAPGHEAAPPLQDTPSPSPTPPGHPFFPQPAPRRGLHTAPQRGARAAPWR